MMRRIWYFLTDTRHLTIIGLTAMAAFFYLGAQVLELALIWALAATALMLLLVGLVWLWRRWRAKRESDLLGAAIGAQAAAEAEAESSPRDQSGAEVKAIRDSMLKAIDTIKGSKMGIVSGTRALYELPWFQVFDKGAMDDAEGREIDFRNTIIIATSNAGSAAIMQACLNQEAPPAADVLESLLRPQLIKHFKPAFLGRLKVVPYYPIPDDVLARIIELKLKRIAQRISDHHHAEFVWDDGLVDAVLTRCTEVDSGARNVDHILNGTLLPEIAEAVLEKMAQGAAIARIKVGANAKGQFKYTIK
jgi:type VI secretion system protein VasG